MGVSKGHRFEKMKKLDYYRLISQRKGGLLPGSRFIFVFVCFFFAFGGYTKKLLDEKEKLRIGKASFRNSKVRTSYFTARKKANMVPNNFFTNGLNSAFTYF